MTGRPSRVALALVAAGAPLLGGTRSPWLLAAGGAAALLLAAVPGQPVPAGLLIVIELAAGPGGVLRSAVAAAALVGWGSPDAPSLFREVAAGAALAGLVAAIPGTGVVLGWLLGLGGGAMLLVLLAANARGSRP